MRTAWRPKDWHNPYAEARAEVAEVTKAIATPYGPLILNLSAHNMICVLEHDMAIYEAGASAMLEALRKEPSSKTVHFDKYAKMNHFRDGIVVFIPDDAARDIPV